MKCYREISLTVIYCSFYFTDNPRIELAAFGAGRVVPRSAVRRRPLAPCAALPPAAVGGHEVGGLAAARLPPALPRHQQHDCRPAAHAQGPLPAPAPPCASAGQHERGLPPPQHIRACQWSVSWRVMM